MMIIENSHIVLFTSNFSNDRLQIIQMDSCPVDFSLIFVPCSTGFGFVCFARDGIPESQIENRGVKNQSQHLLCKKGPAGSFNSIGSSGSSYSRNSDCGLIDNIVGTGTRNGYIGDNLDLVAFCRPRRLRRG
jgi:hypothetical protein